MDKATTILPCALCHTPVSSTLYCSEATEELFFCCKGCQAVFQILQAQGALEHYHNHPVYRQALSSGLISNPQQQAAEGNLSNIPEDDFKKIHLTIDQMWCPSCALVINLILMREAGVRKCFVDYSTDLASIEFTPRLISKEKIVQSIKWLGYEPGELQDCRQKPVSRTLLLRFIVSAFFALNVMMFSYPIYATYFDGGKAEGYAELFAWLSFGGALPVLLYGGWPIWQRCWTSLRVGIWGMEALIAMGVAAAAALSIYELSRGSPYVYFDSLTVIISFVLLGKMIESKAKFSAKDALVHLTAALPRRGRIRSSAGTECFKPIKEFQVGDLLVVKMGEKIVLDGVVEEGSGACDESLMTGEQLPAIKREGSAVLAGTFLQQGHLVIRVTSSLEKTALYSIVDMVSEEVGHKSRYVRAADPIVRWFVPLVACFALLTALACMYWEITDAGQTVLQTAVIRAVSILLISCPCAIGIAAPLAEACLLNRLAKAGILVRNRGCLANLGRESVFVLDKTGTVTEGQFKVCSGLEKLSFDQQRALKGLVSHSLHPIAAALNRALLCPPASFEQIEEIVGKGIRGKFQGCEFCLGSAAWLLQCGIDLPKDSSNHAIATTVYFAKDGVCIAQLCLGDQIRPGVVQFLQSLDVIKPLLVSGDSAEAVSNVAKACHIDAWRAGCLPFQKRELIDQLKQKGEIVAMLGDGINDAPALTAAHVGIAVLSATDISVQASDLLMTTNSFQALTLLRKAAAQGRKIVHQNLFWAFFYNVVGIILAAAGLLTPLFAAFAMTASSLIVLVNAQRLNRINASQY